MYRRTPQKMYHRNPHVYRTEEITSIQDMGVLSGVVLNAQGWRKFRSARIPCQRLTHCHGSCLTRYSRPVITERWRVLPSRLRTLLLRDVRLTGSSYYSPQAGPFFPLFFGKRTLNKTLSLKDWEGWLSVTISLGWLNSLFFIAPTPTYMYSIYLSFYLLFK